MAEEIDPYDIEALERAVNDSAVRVSTIWVSYLVFGLYLVIAASNVTPRQMLVTGPIKLPVFAVDLPLTGFFFLAPILFAVLHAYVLLQLVLLARTASVYSEAVDHHVLARRDRERVRQRLANTLFAQLFAGSSREREGLLGAVIRTITLLALVLAPLLLLLFFDIKFLPFHSHLVTWCHRTLIAIDLLFVLLLWSAAIRPQQDVNWTNLANRPLGLLAATAVVLLACVFLTFPGEFHAGWTRFAAKEDFALFRL